ncbi:type II secretion system protein [Cerasicoccus frondis]|uniref:type II secretion system protein n=1 Tax=Cerasicoccus frondis TaxID=490090 RepID=UPI0028526F5B|nr:prepilin-type N-terminal cleavage/methylation domain-containing protein [Cerasicoccus frondis]
MCINQRDRARRSASSQITEPAPLDDQSVGLKASPSRGFTLLEVMIVVVIIGLLATIAMPAFQRARMRTQSTRFANDLRQFSGAFETYSLEHGAWPDDETEGVLPAGMDGYIAADKFNLPTIYGGNYDWEGPGGGFSGGVAVSIRGSNLDDEQAVMIDEILDDGDLGTGRFQATGDSYALILEQ